jgi:ligand-binding SRPBCC domain-containing protein
MGVHRLEARQVLAVSLDEAWDFFSNPANLSELTPPSMRFEVTSPLPDRVYAGLVVTYRVRPFLGLPVRWVTEISQVEPGRFFVDDQRMGPYRFWHHQHHFREVAGGVEMRDIVHYALPLGLLGDAMNALLVRPQLDEVFSYRAEVLAGWPSSGLRTESSGGEGGEHRR